MKHSLLVFFIACSFFPFGAFAKAKTASKAMDEETVLQTYDIYQLDQAATVLLAAVDAPSPNKNVCGIGGSRALKLSATLHALLDTQTDAYIKDRQAKGKTMSDGTWDTRCAATCSCSIETAILEKVGYGKLAKVDQKAYDAVSKIAAKQSPADVKACLPKFRWVCKSDLLKYVRKTAGKGGAY